MRRLLRLYQSRRARSLTALVCIALLLIATNILARRYLPQHLDLTAERLYMLSPGTLATLARIDEPITLRFYYSPQLGEAVPSYGVYAERVRRLLEQYVAAAHGKLRLEVHRPLPFSAEEDRAVAFGLQGVPLNTAGEQVYFGLAGTNSTDDQQVIAFFDPQRENLLEYDLTRLVHALAVPKRVVVGVVSTLPLDGNPRIVPPVPRAAVLQQLRQSDDVEMLPTTLAAIPQGTDVLLLIHPQKLPQQTLYAIDQFVLRGGKAVVFVDPYSELAARDGEPGGGPGSTPASDLPRLFKAWGLRLLPDTVAGDRHYARRVGVPTHDGGTEAMDYIAWLNLNGDALNHADPITADLQRVTVGSAGILEPLKGAATKFEPLISTSPDAEKLKAEQVAGLPDVASMLTHFHSANTRYVIAAHVTGPAETAFPDGPPKPAAGAAAPAKPEPAPPFVRRSTTPINVVVAADTDMLDDRFWARAQDFFGRRVVVPFANNGDFVADAVDVLAGGNDLVGLRSRGSSVRPFEMVERIQRAAETRYAAEQQALENKLKDTQAKLKELTGAGPKEAKAALAPEQARAVEQFRADIVGTRRQLRAVQAALRRNIEQLKEILEFVDIALVPIIVAAAALVVGALRLRRWRRRRAALA